MTNESIVIPATQIGVPSTVASLRSLSNAGVNTVVVSESPITPAKYSRYCDEYHVVPDPRSDVIGYKNFLLRLAARGDVRSILPIRESDIFVLSKYRSEFSEHLAPIWPSATTLKTVHDRIELFSLAEDIGVPIPETGLSPHGISSRALVVKARYCVLTNDYLDQIPESESVTPPKQLYFAREELPPRSTLIDQMGHDPLVQEYIAGTQYNYRALYLNGTLRVDSQMKKLRSMRYYGGAGVNCELVDIPRLKELGERLLDNLGWEGLASVQFVRDNDSGEFKLLEVNPRLWASVPCDIQAGVDWPRYYWELGTRNRIREPSPHRLGIQTHDLFGEMTHLKSIVGDEFPFADPPRLSRRVFEVGKSLVTDPNFSSLCLRDPLPFVVEGYLRAVQS